MPFRKKNENSENQRFNSKNIKSEGHIFWYISSSVYEKTNIAMHLSLTLILSLILIFDIEINITEKILSDLIKIAVSFGSLSLAIPAFLKNFEIQKTLWISFLTLTILFILSTIIGVVVTVFFPTATYGSQFTLVFVIALVITFNIRTTISFVRLRNLIKHKTIPNLNLRPSEKFDFIGILILIVVALVFGEGEVTPFLIFFFYSLLILLTIIISSLITALSQKPKKDLNVELKLSIQKVLENNPEIAFTESLIIDELRNSYYNGRSNQISKTSVLEAITEMDSEINIDFPVATIFSYDLVIPRWTDQFKEMVLTEIPNIIFFKSKAQGVYEKAINKKLFDEESGEELLISLSSKSKLSVELLKDGNIIDMLVDHLNTIKCKEIQSGYDKRYFFAYNQHFLEKTYNIDRTISVTELGNIYNFIDTHSFISKDFKNQTDRYEVIMTFITSEIFKRKSINDLFQVTEDEVMKFLMASKQDMTQESITVFFTEKWLLLISKDTIFYEETYKLIVKKVINNLDNLSKAKTIAKYQIGEGWKSENVYKLIKDEFLEEDKD